MYCASNTSKRSIILPSLVFPDINSNEVLIISFTASEKTEYLYRQGIYLLYASVGTLTVCTSSTMSCPSEFLKDNNYTIQNKTVKLYKGKT